MAENERPDYVHEAEAAKLRAEADKASADAEAARLEGAANALRLEAETHRLKEETLHIRAERHKAQLEVSEAERKDRASAREEAEKLSENKYHNIFYFNSDVDASSVNSCVRQIDIWRRLGQEAGKRPSEIDVNIVFTSPGGNILSGLVLYDYLQQLKRDGHPVVTGTYGMAASMAGILLQAGNVRWMGREAWVLIHEAAFMAMGKIGEIQDTTIWISRIQKRILDIFASRAIEVLNTRDPEKKGRTFTIESHTKDEANYDVTLNEKQDCIDFFAKKWRRADWWLSSEESIRYGIVDEVR